MKWISVRKSLPKIGDKCAVYDRSKNNLGIAFYDGKRKWSEGVLFGERYDYVTHWILLKDIGFKIKEYVETPITIDSDPSCNKIRIDDIPKPD